MMRGFRVMGRAGTAVALSAGLVVTGTTGAGALAFPGGDAPGAISAPAAGPVFVVTGEVAARDVLTGLPADVLPGTTSGGIDGLLGTITGAIDGLLDAVLGLLGLSQDDGVGWSPSHEEETAIIPVCSGPTATLDWLFVNFSDHGTDLGQFLADNGDHIAQIVTGSADPYQTLQYVLAPFLQVPVYAINDTTFHVPATLGDILAFCESTRT